VAIQSQGEESHIPRSGTWLRATQLNSLPEGTLLGLRILRDQGVFEAKGRVVYSDPGFGMGLAFTETTLDLRLVLETWLAQIVCQFGLVYVALLRSFIAPKKLPLE
jgi:hypothetical protein